MDYYVSPIPGDIGDGLILGFLGCISLCHYMGTWWYRILVIFMGIWVISCYIYIILINYIPLGIVWTWVTYMFFANHEGKITWNITSNHGIILRMVAKSRTTSDGWKLRQSTNWCRISQPFTVWFAAFVLKKHNWISSKSLRDFSWIYWTNHGPWNSGRYGDINIRNFTSTNKLGSYHMEGINSNQPPIMGEVLW